MRFFTFLLEAVLGSGCRFAFFYLVEYLMLNILGPHGLRLLQLISFHLFQYQIFLLGCAWRIISDIYLIEFGTEN